jgi:hypothetical protein
MGAFSLSCVSVLSITPADRVARRRLASSGLIFHPLPPLERLRRSVESIEEQEGGGASFTLAWSIKRGQSVGGLVGQPGRCISCAIRHGGQAGLRDKRAEGRLEMAVERKGLKHPGSASHAHTKADHKGGG